MSHAVEHQRIRVTFAKVGATRYVAHLDLMRTWERAIRRARLPLAYTQGFSPHARLALAAPLPVGVAGHRELLDLWLSERRDPTELVQALRAALPSGLEVIAAEEVPEALPSLQSGLHSGTYEVRFEPGALDADWLRERIDWLLAQESLEWEEERGDKTRRYDLRATVLALDLREEADALVLHMDLSLEAGRTGRPQQVLRALDVQAEPLDIARTAIRLGETASAGR